MATTPAVPLSSEIQPGGGIEGIVDEGESSQEPGHQNPRPETATGSTTTLPKGLGW